MKVIDSLSTFQLMVIVFIPSILSFVLRDASIVALWHWNDFYSQLWDKYIYYRDRPLTIRWYENNDSNYFPIIENSLPNIWKKYDWRESVILVGYICVVIPFSLRLFREDFFRTKSKKVKALVIVSLCLLDSVFLLLVFYIFYIHKNFKDWILQSLPFWADNKKFIILLFFLALLPTLYNYTLPASFWGIHFQPVIEPLQINDLPFNQIASYSSSINLFFLIKILINLLLVLVFFGLVMKTSLDFYIKLFLGGVFVLFPKITGLLFLCTIFFYRKG